jgi:hypothetical protein
MGDEETAQAGRNIAEVDERIVASQPLAVSFESPRWQE